MRKNKGFTLIEFLIVIFAIAILIVLSAAGYRFFEKKTELENTAQNILATLKLAQSKTLASEEASQYGVNFESDKYTLFKGDAYLPAAADNKIHQIPNRLEIYNINLADEGSSVVFQRIDGTTEQNGTIGLRIISKPTETKTITIQPSGQIESNAVGAECCTDNRISDTRHIHLDLGWSIQGSSILTLYFPDAPAVTENINMVDYFDVAETEFDWNGIIEVNGQNQELRIHTHSLDAINTILCIHRAQDANNKPLQISIDAKDLISYTADGATTVEAFGGAIEIQ